MDVASIPKPRGVAAVCLLPEEEQKILDVLLALGKQGKVLWRYTDIKYATALLADTAVPEGKEAAQQFMLVPGRILVSVGSVYGDPLEGCFSVARPLTEGAIILALNDAVGHLSSQSETTDASIAEAPVAAIPRAPETAKAPPGHRLIDAVRNVMEEDGGVPAFIFTGPGLPRLALSPKAKKVLSDKPWDEVKSFNFATPVEVEDVAVGDPILPRLVLDGQPLHYLLWLAGLHSGRGQLMPFLDAAKPYKLTRWPEFGTIDFTPQFLKVMSYLSKHAASLPDVSAWSGIAKEDVADLMNAAGLCGYLTLASSDDRVQAAPQPTEAMQEKRGLFNRIRNKLGMLQTG
jgi:hypothetical protein